LVILTQKNLYESSYTYIWDKLLSRGVGLEEYGCSSATPSNARKVNKEKFDMVPADPTEKGKTKQVDFQKEYMKICAPLLTSFNNIIASRVINVHQPSLAPIYGKPDSSLTGFIIKNLIFANPRSGNLSSWLPFFKNVKLQSDIIFPSYLSGGFVTIKLKKQIITNYSKEEHNRRHFMETVTISALDSSHIFNSLIKYDDKEMAKIKDKTALIEYLIRPFGSNSKDLYKQYPLNIVENPSVTDYSINDILEDISILYSIYCEEDSVDWFLTNRKLADTGNDTTDLNRRIARELLYLSLVNLIWYVKICFNKIKDELTKSEKANKISKELNSNICITLDNITNIMFYNAADLFSFLETFLHLQKIKINSVQDVLKAIIILFLLEKNKYGD